MDTNNVKTQLNAAWAKVVENKATVIRVGGSLVGAAIGVAIAHAILKSSTYDVTVELAPASAE